jgi:hypothetical protein
MIAFATRNNSRSVPRHTARFTRWGGWLGLLLLAGHLIFCHGCHGDEDNELCMPPPVREKSETRNPKSEETQKVTVQPASEIDIFGRNAARNDRL